MIRALAALLFSACCTLPALAQVAASNDYGGNVYLFVALGADSTRAERQARTGPLASVALGGGLERFVHKGLALGAEYGFASTSARWGYSPTTDKTSYNRTRWLMLNSAYHFKNFAPANDVVPFVAGGLGAMSFAGRSIAPSGNYGAGLTWWRSSYGWRFEVRRHVTLNEERGRFTGVRFGLAIR